MASDDRAIRPFEEHLGGPSWPERRRSKSAGSLGNGMTAHPLRAGEATTPGRPERFGARWRLVGAGLSNVWDFGDLVMPATSGRLLMRGPNGTGKTTALEALWPYLLDLNPARMAAGKGRQTTLAMLMERGAAGKRRYGYLWLTFAGPAEAGECSFGVRLQYSRDAKPK